MPSDWVVGVSDILLTNPRATGNREDERTCVDLAADLAMDSMYERVNAEPLALVATMRISDPQDSVFGCTCVPGASYGAESEGKEGGGYREKRTETQAPPTGLCMLRGILLLMSPSEASGVKVEVGNSRSRESRRGSGPPGRCLGSPRDGGGA